MRRGSLITQVHPTGHTYFVGTSDPSTTDATNEGDYIYVSTGTAVVASRTPSGPDGTLTSITADFAVSGNVLFFIGDGAGNVNYVDSSGVKAVSTGVHTYSISLPVYIGGYLGVWCEDGIAVPRLTALSPGDGEVTVSTYFLDAMQPVDGGIYAMSFSYSDYALSMYATG